jgi:hypothetical protein
MSFLDNNSSEYLTGRITQNGRRAIASGNFNIGYFTIGDSEFVYRSEFSGMTGSTLTQKVFAPFDKDSNVKYPIKYTNDTLTGTTIYGLPITGNTTTSLRNAMGPAGFVSDYSGSTLGTTIECTTNTVAFSTLSGSTKIAVTKASGTTYDACQYVTLAFNTFTNSTNLKAVTNSLVYKVIGVTGATSGTTQTIELDRTTPNLTALSGNANVVCNKCEMEFDTLADINNTCIPPLPNPEDQHNPWTLDIVWSKKPIGIVETSTNTRPLSGYTGSRFIGVKELLGYKTTSGQTTNTGITYTNSYGEVKIVKPEEQKALALIHYSEIGDIVNDPDRFYKYDDYISTTTTGVTNDQTYFQVYIPFLMYHRNTGSTIRAIFNLGSAEKYVTSAINTASKIKYRDLVDEMGVNVGKVFVNNKVIVFDDEEIVAALDYKSNRRYTLPAPKVGLTPSIYNSTNALMYSTGQTLWLTYMLVDSNDTKLNALPCNYLTKITGTTTTSEAIFSFNGQFPYLKTDAANRKTGFLADNFFALAQITDQTDADQLPDNNKWKKVDFTSADIKTNGFIDPTKLSAKTFTLYLSGYTGGSTFDLTTHITGTTFTGTTAPHFGDSQPFPGSVKLVRASDIEEMNFLINLPGGKFSTSQNPTNTGQNPMITEIALLDANKTPLIIAKAPKPIKRTGTQVFSVKLDF